LREPYPKYKAMKYKRPVPTVLSYEEIKPIIDAHTPFWKAFFLCLYHAGMRFNEARTLRWKAIDQDTHVVNVIEMGNKERSIPLTPMLEEALKAIPNGKEFVFINKRTGELYTDVRKPLKAAMKKAEKTGKINPHKFRHSFARLFWKKVLISADSGIIGSCRGHNHADLYPCNRRTEEKSRQYAVWRLTH